MTYRELYDKAEWKLEKGEITIGEFDEMTKSLDEEIRPHGEWIRNDNGTYSCSVCQSWIPNEQHYYARYCLHCGSVMKEGDRNEVN